MKNCLRSTKNACRSRTLQNQALLPDAMQSRPTLYSCSLPASFLSGFQINLNLTFSCEASQYCKLVYQFTIAPPRNRQAYKTSRKSDKKTKQAKRQTSSCAFSWAQSKFRCRLINVLWLRCSNLYKLQLRGE